MQQLASIKEQWDTPAEFAPDGTRLGQDVPDFEDAGDLSNAPAEVHAPPEPEQASAPKPIRPATASAARPTAKNDSNPRPSSARPVLNRAASWTAPGASTGGAFAAVSSSSAEDGANDKSAGVRFEEGAEDLAERRRALGKKAAGATRHTSSRF